MGLKQVFKKAAKTAFKVADDVKINAIYRTINDDGFNPIYTNDVDLEVIRLEFTADDYRELSFKDLIQPLDFKILILCEDISSVDMNDTVIIDSIEYSIIGFEKDAADAVWTVGLR